MEQQNKALFCVKPLWHLFPDRDPLDILTARQGAEEMAKDAWWEHWYTLSDEQKETYLVHYQAPETWRTHIRSITSYDDFDDEADAAESEAYWQSRKAQHTSLPILQRMWKHLFPG